MLISWIVFFVFALVLIANFAIMARNTMKGIETSSSFFPGFKGGFLRHIILAGLTSLSFVAAVVITILHFVSK